jgi:hypothetical protein
MRLKHKVNDMRRGLLALLVLAPLTSRPLSEVPGAMAVRDDDLVIVDGWVLLRSDLRSAESGVANG